MKQSTISKIERIKASPPPQKTEEWCESLNKAYDVFRANEEHLFADNQKPNYDPLKEAIFNLLCSGCAHRMLYFCANRNRSNNINECFGVGFSKWRGLK